MIRREDALKAFAEDEFDLVVIGGGITGAGVALDAATRGYSVALVEREDFASGTSSRSSKLVHGGLRYLQNFDLGLVREALLERSILVNLAPHLVRPLPLLVPSFEGKRPDRMLGMGLNMYDRMARELKRPGKRGREPFMGEEDWSPEKHRIIEGDEVRELLPALAPREPTAALPLLRLPDRRRAARADRARRGRALRRGAARTAAASTSCSTDDGRAVRRALHGHGRRRRVRDPRRRTWSTRPACGRTRSARRSCTTRRTSRASVPAAARTSPSPQDDLPINVGAIVPAGGGRSIFALPWLGRTLIGTTDNDYEGALEHVPPDEDDIEYLLDAVNKYFETSLGARAHHRRLRGRAPADLDRRPEEVGRHLAQGGAVRDELGPGHDHRRQADDLAADGEDGRRPDRRARGPRGAVPHARDPARAERDRGGPRRRRR